MKYGLSLPNGGVCGDARVLADLGCLAEEAGWDGVFVEDYIVHQSDGAVPTCDPWIALAAMAVGTNRVRLGTSVTPLNRRRPWKVAREAVALDQLSNGRFILGVGSGDGGEAGFSRVNEVRDAKERAKILDEALDVIVGLWSGEPFSYDGQYFQVREMTFLPTPVQQPRIPIWVAARWPGGPGAYRRAARYDGVFPIAPDPNRDIVTAEQVAELRAALGDVPAGFEIAINGASELDPTACAEAGATWWIETYFSVDEVKRRAAEGPPS